MADSTDMPKDSPSSDDIKDGKKIQEQATITKQDNQDNTNNYSYDQSQYWDYYKQYYSQYYQQRGDWMAIYDQNTHKYYYYNASTKLTQWEKPTEWDTLPPSDPGNIPTSSPDNTTTSSETVTGPKKRSLAELVSIWLKRPARKQVEEQQKVHWRPEGAQEYNIWYDRWVGELWKGERHGGEWIHNTTQIASLAVTFVLAFKIRLLGTHIPVVKCQAIFLAMLNTVHRFAK